MWETEHTGLVEAAPEAVWRLWADPARWPEWNEQVASAELDGELAPGATATVKFERGGRMAFRVLVVEPGRLFTDEARLIGARFGHEHRIEPTAGGVDVTHRLYLTGPFAGLYAVLFGRKRMTESVEAFIERERELA